MYRLLTADTYELQMFRRSCEKLTLDKLVLQVSSLATAAASFYMPGLATQSCPPRDLEHQ